MIRKFLRVNRAVKFFGNCWNVQQSDDEMRPIKLAGSPVNSFINGWHPTVVIDFGLNVHLLELTHDSGRQATWFLDNDYNHLTDNIRTLEKELRIALQDRLSEPILQVYYGLLSAPTLSSENSHFVFERINDNTIRDLLSFFVDELLGPCKVIALHEFDVQKIELQHNCKTVSFVHLNEVFQSDLRELTDQALYEGHISCVSPISGTKVKSNKSLIIHEHRMAYRFIDPDYNFVFYLSMTHHPTKIADLYIPELNVVFTALPDDSRTPHSAVVIEYLTHFVLHSQNIVKYFQDIQHYPAVVCRGYPGMHIGHQLWNELTAYERLATTMDKKRLPIVVVPNADRGSEAYGPIDALFPEWKGKVDRSLQMAFEGLAEFTYRKNLFLFRALDHYVTVKLSKRLVRVAQTIPTTLAARNRIVQVTEQGFTLVTLGLRVENRTAVNFYDVLEQTITRIAQRIPKLAIILDGHNSRLNGDLTTTFDSFGQPSCKNPILTELELAIRLRHHFEHTQIQIISTIGNSVLDSIVWIEASAFFVAVWGAGLAKYRWTCNKIGLVISSRSNLTSRHDLHIYDSPEFQEDPAPILYIDPMAVTDCPDAPVLFSPVNPVPASYANFHVDCVQLIPQIDRLLEMALSSRFETA